MYRSKKVSGKEGNLRKEAEKWFMVKVLFTHIRTSIQIPLTPALRRQGGGSLHKWGS